MRHRVTKRSEQPDLDEIIPFCGYTAPAKRHSRIARSTIYYPHLDTLRIGLENITSMEGQLSKTPLTIIHKGHDAMVAAVQYLRQHEQNAPQTYTLYLWIVGTSADTRMGCQLSYGRGLESDLSDLRQ